MNAILFRFMDKAQPRSYVQTLTWNLHVSAAHFRAIKISLKKQKPSTNVYHSVLNPPYKFP